MTKSNYSSNTIQLPQIVVIGNQSSGKSSLLESIIGQEFLPKGIGIATRRPIVIQLFHKNDADTMYAELVHKKGKKFVDFEEIRKEIEEDTNKVAGSNKGVSNLPLVVKIYSKSMINLSLIDLPGLAKVPIGDQPQDIEEKIRNLNEFYIENPNSLILCVLPANVDIANSDALKLARKVDPEGNRTLGVVTKLDIMETGTSAIDLLEGKVYPLKLGFFGVVCRDQGSIKKGMTLLESRDKEMKFFSDHSDYKSLTDNLGMDNLTKNLNYQLTVKIKNYLPSIRSKIYTLLQKNEAELRLLGDNLFSDDGKSTKKAVLLTIITKFCRELIDILRGQGLNQTFRNNELFGGARINFIFNEVFRKIVNEIDPFETVCENDIRAAIKNANGLNPSLLVSEDAFKVLVKEQIRNSFSNNRKARSTKSRMCSAYL